MGLSKMNRAIIFGVSWAAIVIGLVLGILWIPIFNAILTKELVLSPSSQSYEMWKETPIPMYLEIYLFNWTNSDEITKPNSKPHFDELGPYVFREVDSKVNQVWNDNGTVTFQQNRVWYFEKSRSKGSLDDKITNLNVVAATIAYKVRNKRLLPRKAVDALIKLLHEPRILTKTARELLFDGYEDKILEFAQKFNMSTMPGTKFGWFYGRNNSKSYDGTFNMLTGITDRNRIGIIQEWNYSNKSKIYPGQCSAIDGTLGDVWPHLTNNDTVSIFAPDVCTLLHLRYEKSSEFGGLMGKKFISTAEMLDNGTNVHSRACYYQGHENLPSGLLNVSQCKFDAPAFISLPHFYLADESYLNAVDGLQPKKEKHEFSVVVQPDVGIPLQVNARLQLNLQIQSIKDIEIYENIPKIYIPVLWFRQEANMTSQYTDKIKFVLNLPLFGRVTFYGIAGLGVLLFFIGICILIRARRKAEDAQKLIAKAEAKGVNDNEE